MVAAVFPWRSDMLVITRCSGESFWVGDEIEIRVLEAGSQVRIGISAPREIEIVRAELVAESDLEYVPE